MKFHLANIFVSGTLAIASVTALSSCDDNKSYAELLTDENKAVNLFLSNQNVILDIPADSVFISGPDAPYYRLDEDNNVYMQVINPGDKTNKAKNDQLIYFRFTRYNLSEYASTGVMPEGWGNAEDMSIGSASFRFGNYTLTTSSQWGSGLQMPLYYLGIDCEVNLVVKSQYGLSSEIASVIPFLYNVRYFSAMSN